MGAALTQGVSKAQVQAVLRRLEKALPEPYTPPNILPVPFIEAGLGVELDPWQLDYVENAPLQRRIAIVACRQSGKSTVTAGYVAWCLVHIPFFMVLIASRSLRQASYYLEKVQQAVQFYLPRKTISYSNRLSIGLSNGAQAVSIPCRQPDAGRGFSPDMVVLDEAAFAPEELLAALTPSIAATGGAIHMLSSANGPQGFFYHACEGDNADAHYTLKVPYQMCPRISEDFLEIERRTLGDVRFRSEYCAEFLAAEGAFFGYHSLNDFIEGDEPPFDDEDIPTPEQLDAAREDWMEALDWRQRVTRMLYE